MEKLKHCLYTLVHPFNGFDAIKWEKKGSVLIAVFGLLLQYVSAIYQYQGTGFIFNTNNPDKLNILLIAVSSFIPFLVFSVANWSVCTLFDGEGKFSEIVIVIGYALIPMSVINILTTFASNFILSNEEAFLSMIGTVGLIWSLAVGFVGLMTVHQYTFKQTFLAVLASLVGVFIIMFIVVLVATLYNQLYSFVASIYNEIRFRI
jgi:hypothetical protein